VDGAIDSLGGFRDAALDKWHRRTVLSSGTAALRGSSGLRALQQSVSSQVSALMASEREKLISRSQLPMELAPRPLGQPPAPATATAGHGDGEDGGSPAAAAAAAAGRGRARDPETYDEGDFYSQLLKELLESGVCCWPGGGAFELQRLLCRA
jgi:protein AATF/BFR2